MCDYEPKLLPEVIIAEGTYSTHTRPIYMPDEEMALRSELVLSASHAYNLKR